MQRKFKVIATTVALGAVLAGCAANQGELGNRSNYHSQSVRYDMNGNRILDKRFANDQMNEMNRVDGRRLNSNNIVGKHDNYRLDMSENIANKLTTIPEVKTANVMLTNHNAYVAVSLRDGLGAASGAGSRTIHRSNIGGTNYVGEMNGVGSRDITRFDSQTATPGYEPYRVRSNNGATDYITPSRQHTYSTNATNSYGMNGMSGVRGHGYGMYSTNGGAAANADIQLTDALKNRIADEVKRIAPNVNNVYVSANPDFVDRMSGYWNDVKAGHPIQGFVAEFNAMVERLFPAEAGTRR
ncbi:Sporulation lipoprotein YhcN/YlaJ-like protein [Paenibacillus curdlanolyticus YK9]|uniref:Sporulation lipoprotein YhcN/YlaJ-like protein n=1 Tax=Paenibacillus curdlanolyticus YK9 TaxID=717606 RepID=E0IFB0_9BACL|nr:YhcN/YlaJ family sporulation lipoprotein [Paenibacillus curdlanolyticus]EFM08886.1 Sporulation lipoprotein YhcN/YlaJ-like protein [Paenibacillus curdlanolyticus YK9]